MVKILYGISGTGNGHAMRAAEVISYLKKNHNVIAVTQNNAFKILSKRFPNTIEMVDFTLKYVNNKVSAGGTFLVDLILLPKIIKSLFYLHTLIKKEKPDLIINDFSGIMSISALVHRMPMITVDNNQFVLKAKLELPKRWWWSAFKAKFAIRFMVPTANHRFISSFFFPKVKRKTTLVPPIIRKEIRNLKTKSKDYVLVYQTTDTNKELVKILKKIKEKFIVYGFGSKKPEENITFKPFSEKGFLKDLSSAKAVIMNGGFSLMTECIHLNKPVLSIPVKAQIEQMINAIHLEKKGLGVYSKDNDKEKIIKFLNNLQKYKTNMKKCNFDHDLLFKKLEDKIKELTA